MELNCDDIEMMGLFVREYWNDLMWFYCVGWVGRVVGGCGEMRDELEVIIVVSH